MVHTGRELVDFRQCYGCKHRIANILRKVDANRTYQKPVTCLLHGIIYSLSIQTHPSKQIIESNVGSQGLETG